MFDGEIYVSLVLVQVCQQVHDPWVKELLGMKLVPLERSHKTTKNSWEFTQNRMVFESDEKRDISG